MCLDGCSLPGRFVGRLTWVFAFLPVVFVHEAQVSEQLVDCMDGHIPDVALLRATVTA